MAYLEFFPEEITELQKELQKHPELLKSLEGKDVAESLAEIGAHLGILLDGLYTPLELCQLFLKKLREKSSLVVVPDHNNPLIPIRIRENKEKIIIEQESSKPLQNQEKS